MQLKEVGNDLNKKNTLVNQIAETLSKINKPEDFTKLQEYVKNVVIYYALMKQA